MGDRTVLQEVEGQLASVPPDSVKHDLQPAFEAMANWIRTLDQGRRLAVTHALPQWFSEHHPWHSRAALEIALLLRDRDLIEQAVKEAERQGIQDIPAPVQYPDWLAFQLDLIRVLAEWGASVPDAGVQYLRTVSDDASRAASYSRRLLAIRAWLTLCRNQREAGCLKEAVVTLRGWQDDRLQRSGLSLIHAYYCGRDDDDDGSSLKTILTREELAIACPQALTK